jgi:hypothetical protein
VTTALADEPLIVKREWPWGLAFVHDSAWSEPAPTGWLEDDAVVTTRGEIIAKILHQVDGEATLQVSLVPPVGLTLVRQCELDIPSGMLLVSDAAKERVDRVVLTPGLWDATVWTDRAESPTRVAICLSPKG